MNYLIFLVVHAKTYLPLFTTNKLLQINICHIKKQQSNKPTKTQITQSFTIKNYFYPPLSLCINYNLKKRVQNHPEVQIKLTYVCEKNLSHPTP